MISRLSNHPATVKSRVPDHQELANDDIQRVGNSMCVGRVLSLQAAEGIDKDIGWRAVRHY